MTHPGRPEGEPDQLPLLPPDQFVTPEREVPDFPPAVAASEPEELPMETFDVVSLKVRNERLWKAANLLASMSKQTGLTRAQFNVQIAQDLQDDRGVEVLTHYNEGIKSGATTISKEGARDRRVRTLFSQGSGYETTDPFDKQPKTPEQELGNRALQKFKATFEGKDGAKARNDFRKKLKKTATTFNFPDYTGK